MKPKKYIHVAQCLIKAVIRWLILYLIYNSATVAWAQKDETDYPRIGNLCPAITLNNVTHFSKQKITLSDFKGKWLILDLWSHGCASCIKSLPKLNDLQKEFSAEVQFLLIAPDAKNDGALFERLCTKYNLAIPSAYDSSLAAKFGVDSVPHVVIIDKEGKVWAVTNSQFLTHDNVLKMIRGENPHFEYKQNAFEKTEQRKKKLIVPDTQFLFQSALSRWSKGYPINIVTSIDRQLDKGIYKTSATSLNRLYNIAYLGVSDWSADDSLYGKFWSVPIYKFPDSAQQQSNDRYNYTLTVPQSKASRAYMQWAMQCDLKKVFGYDVSIETRTMPCWKLVQLKSDIDINTQGNSPIISSDYTGLKLINCSVQTLLNKIANYHQKEPPLIDATQIKNNIDISFDALMIDLQEIQKALRQHGLELQKSSRPIKVIVIRNSLRENENQ